MSDIVNKTGGLDIRQRKNPEILAYLAAGKSIKETADLCHVSTRTITRRLQRPAFLAALEKARARMIDSAIGSLSQGAAKAAKRLFELMDSTSPTVAISACRSVLEFGLKWKYFEHTSRDVEQLKQFFQKMQNKGYGPDGKPVVPVPILEFAGSDKRPADEQ